MNQENNMAEFAVYLCKNSLPDISSFPVQWTESGMHVRVKLVPCSGKIDIQYMLHTLEAGRAGICVITCPHGECTLSQGNYRADIRVRSLKNLLGEIGLDPDCVTVIHTPSGSTADDLKGLVDSMVKTLAGKTAARV